MNKLSFSLNYIYFTELQHFLREGVYYFGKPNLTPHTAITALKPCDLQEILIILVVKSVRHINDVTPYKGTLGAKPGADNEHTYILKM